MKTHLLKNYLLNRIFKRKYHFSDTITRKLTYIVTHYYSIIDLVIKTWRGLLPSGGLTTPRISI